MKKFQVRDYYRELL